MHRLQGPAAEFVFDEVCPESLADYRSLIIELNPCFKSVETHKTYRAQFAKRIQYFNESIEEYAAELKHLYDKSYPGKKSEMRRQLLLQQFMNRLKDKKAKFAVEYYKEPTSIEDAVYHVVTCMKTQQGPHFENGNSTRRSKKNVRFHDTGDYADADIGSDDETWLRLHAQVPNLPPGIQLEDRTVQVLVIIQMLVAVSAQTQTISKESVPYFKIVNR